MRRLSLLIWIVFLSCYRTNTETASLSLVNNQGYYKEFHRLVQESCQSIYLCMFVAKLREGTLVEYIYQDLADATSRGIDVRVILDSSYYDSSLNAENTAFAESLRKVGIRVCFDTPFPTTHAKFGIFDHSTVLIGSTNWTESSLERNNEVNIVVQNRDIAEDLEDYFFKLWREND